MWSCWGCSSFLSCAILVSCLAGLRFLRSPFFSLLFSWLEVMYYAIPFKNAIDVEWFSKGWFIRCRSGNVRFVVSMSWEDRDI